MKRVGYLIEDIADYENLLLAFWKAKKGKSDKKDMIEFQNNLDVNINNLRNQILENNVKIGSYNFFKIFDPKEREICAAAFSERVLHHAIMNICHPYFEKKQIFHSYATRKDKGTFKALNKAKENTKKYKWFLKMDIKKYFDSISHDVLKGQLRRIFKDKYLLNIFYIIIDSYSKAEFKGLPIGNLTSQYFANLYLSFVDHFALEVLKVRGYVRYMDDIIIWGNSKNELIQKGKEFKNYIINKLKLEFKCYYTNRCNNGVNFLGFIVFSDKTKLNKRSKSRFIAKMKMNYYDVNHFIITQDEFQISSLSLCAFTRHANSEAFRYKVLKNEEGY